MQVSKLVPLKDLVPGKRYRVEFDDCCVRGAFEGRFLEWAQEQVELGHDLEDAAHYIDARFDFGYVTGWAWTATEIAG